MSSRQGIVSNFLEKHENGQRLFECNICKRVVKSKRSIQQHLWKQHNFSPTKSCYKLHEKNNNNEVPRSTLYRWQARSRKSLAFCGSCEIDVQDCSSDVHVSIQNKQDDLESTITGIHIGGTSEFMTVTSNPPSDDVSDCDWSNQESLSETTSESDISADDLSSTNASDVECSCKSDFENDALVLLQCFKKHKLTDTACHDILKTIKHVVPAAKDNPLLSYRKLLSHVPDTNYREVQYCHKCESIIDRNNDQNLQCRTPNCFGAVKSFMLADLEGLLRKLLYVPGILEDIMKTLKDIKQSMTCDTISDIYSGEIYKKQFVNENTRDIQLTCILNTDGVNLYKSSKVELWPVYLAINELHASHRFSRENILLIALWQGKGKPSFKIYFEQIIEEINTLTEKGLQMDCGEENWNVYMNVIGITLDLPAKAGVLNMTQFNGLEACITCEEPGLVVRQGRGHSRCYPYRPTSSRFPERSVEGVLESMESATVRNRQKGFKGMSGIARLLKFELVYGIVPDYMHCVLFGIVKTILSKWFSPTQSGNDYFVGKHLKQINERLLQIQPPHYIERLPRDIEKHYANYKATELQAFLLFYALPCLTGIQKENFLQHLALLSEAIFILLGDSLTQNCLERSELLLGQFYSQFSELYGEGSCGLNVHNACAHLPMYVRKLGPVWAWSCFGFEDANANILQSVHGTGDVVKQALRKQETALYVRSSNKIQLKSLKHLKVSHQAQNCAIIGSLKSVCSNLPDYVYEALGVESCVNLKKVLRIFVNNKTFYSFAYSRMKKRNSYTVLYSEDEIGQIQYFVLNFEFNLVYAVISKMNECVNSWLSNFQGAKHLKCVVKTNCHRVVYVDQLKATLIYMKSPTGDCGVIARLPNTLGHAIFK